MNSSSSKVNCFLADIESTFPNNFEIVENIRALFFEENSTLIDDIKYGGLVFNVASKLVGGIYLYKEHISIEFSDGASFTDPSNLLEGKGKLRRHLKIQSFDDIEAKSARFFIKQAVKSI
jgi:hypothetical protein